MVESANARKLTVAELEKVSGGGQSQMTDYTSMMNLMSKVSGMMSDMRKSIASNIR